VASSPAKRQWVTLCLPGDKECGLTALQKAQEQATLGKTSVGQGTGILDGVAANVKGALGSK